jgi:hypothetical protein
MRRRTIRQLAAFLVALIAVGTAYAQGPDNDKRESVVALNVALEVEQALLEGALESYRAISRERPDSIARLSQFYQSLEAEVGRGAAAVPERIDQLMEMALQAEADLGARLVGEREALARVREHLRRFGLLRRQIAALDGAAREDEDAGALTGTWDLALMPIEQRGSCVLKQTGAVVSGTYRLQGGYSGSLQGTLVNRQVYLVRIDSRLGKMMELEGFLSSDGKQIRGTWLNYELAGAEGARGHWSATLREPEP